jgi:hypothetical protein
MSSPSDADPRQPSPLEGEVVQRIFSEAAEGRHPNKYPQSVTTILRG